MDTIQNFSKLINEISNTSEQIIRKAVPIMNMMLKDNKKLIERIKKEKPDIEEKDILPKLKDISLNLITDARVVKKELPDFINGIINGTLENIDTPFLKEIWYGDTYDCSGHEALKELHNDLKNQLDTCTLDGVISKI